MFAFSRMVIILTASSGSMGKYIVVGLAKSIRNFLSAMTCYEVQRRTKDDRLYKKLVLCKDGFFYNVLM